MSSVFYERTPYPWRDMRPGQFFEVKGAHVPGFRSTASSAAKRLGILLEVNDMRDDVIKCWRVDIGDGVTPMTQGERREMYAAAVPVVPCEEFRLPRDVAAAVDLYARVNGLDRVEAIRRAVALPDDGDVV